MKQLILDACIFFEMTILAWAGLDLITRAMCKPILIQRQEQK